MNRLLAVQTLGVLISFIVATFWTSAMCIFKPEITLLLVVNGVLLCAGSITFCIFLPDIIVTQHGKKGEGEES